MTDYYSAIEDMSPAATGEISADKKISAEQESEVLSTLDRIDKKTIELTKRLYKIECKIEKLLNTI